MSDTAIKQCNVVLKPCSAKLTNCYVSMGQRSPSRSCSSARDEQSIRYSATTDEINGKLQPTSPKLKKCVVVLEPCTPKVETGLTAELKRAINEKNIFTSKTKTKLISALSELEATNKENSRKSRKSQAIREIQDSEAAYLKQLEVITKFFKKPLMERNILSHDDIEKLFGTISIIYNVNEELLTMLDENPVDVGRAFFKIAPFLKLYSAYAYDYKMILSILQQNEAKNEEFHKFISNQESRPEVQAKLPSLLIAPIQRIPRYCLLLRQVLINTLPAEDDYEILKESLKKVEESARHTDTLVQERENSERLLKIQNILHNNNPVIIRPGRKLVKEGCVLKIDGAHSTQLYLVAMSDILMFCKIKKEDLKAKNSLRCTCILPLHKCKVRQNPLSRNVEIRCVNEIFLLYIDKQSEFEEWVNVLKASVMRYLFNRHTLRKESSSRRPAFGKDFQNYSDASVSPRQPHRKRKVVESDLILNGGSTKMKQSGGVGSHLYSFITKRKCIRDSADRNLEVNQENPKKKTNDSLFPLRRHFLPPQDIVIEPTTTDTDDNNGNSETDGGVFVFGKPNNPNRGFNFRIASFFTCIGNSFRKVFGFK